MEQFLENLEASKNCAPGTYTGLLENMEREDITIDIIPDLSAADFERLGAKTIGQQYALRKAAAKCANSML
jgi:hypothetical protein